MSKELKQDKYEGLGNGPWIKGYFPTAKQECIWNIPEEKRYFHCKFCTANCVNAHAVSTPTELEQAAEEFAEHYADEREYEYPVEETDVAAGFKAGAEWQKKQM